MACQQGKIMSQLEQAIQTMYGPDGLGVTNLKLTLGTNRDVTVEQIAREINAVLSEIRRENEDIR